MIQGSYDLSCPPTWADDPSILYMGTVVLPQLIQQFTTALQQVTLISKTVESPEEDGSIALTKECLSCCQSSYFTVRRIPKLSTHHLSTVHRPVIITDCAPAVVKAKLHSSFVLYGAIHQSEVAVFTQFGLIRWHCANQILQ